MIGASPIFTAANRTCGWRTASVTRRSSISCTSWASPTRGWRPSKRAGGRSATWSAPEPSTGWARSPAVLVTSTSSPALLRGIIDELQSVADQVPPGEDRWSLRTYLADAIRKAGQPDQSLTLYEQAAAEAEAAEHWSDVAWICGNWANSLCACGQLDASRAKHMESAAARRKAGNPEVNVVGSELEALRIDVMQGRAEAVLPEIESRLDRVRQWWQQTRAGQSVPAAPDAVVLGRALISGLDIAR